jgi:hypothetical protein
LSKELKELKELNGFQSFHDDTNMKKKNIKILEMRTHNGGRMKTSEKKDNDNNNDVYEKGAWRVRRGDKETEKLLRELEIARSPIHPRRLQQRSRPIPEGDDGQRDTFLSSRDKIILDGHRAEWRYDKGYHGILDKAAGTRVYGAGDQHYDGGDDEEKNQSPYDYVEKGWGHVIRKLTEELLESEKCVEIKNNCRYTGFDGTTVRWIDKEGKSRAERASAVVLAIPPSVFPPGDDLPELAATVRSHSLCHVWFDAGEPVKPHVDAVSPWPLSQVSSNPMQPSNLVHVYATDRDAEFWRRLRYAEIEDPRRFSTVATALEQLKSTDRRYKSSRIPQNPRKWKFHDLNYWEHAVHSWVPCTTFPGTEEAQRRALCPDWRRRPNLFVCGEAFSRSQGWAEGALETARLVVEEIVVLLLKKNTDDDDNNNNNNKKSKASSSSPNENTTNQNKNQNATYKGYSLNVPEKWKAQHPGGEEILNEYLYGKKNTDIETIWTAIHGTSVDSLATIFFMLETKYD